MEFKSATVGLLSFFEKIIRGHPLIYIFIRSVVRFTNIFEKDFDGLKILQFEKKINIIDVGASDGIAANFFLKNLNVGNIYCYEPHSLFINKLKKLKRKNPKIKIFKHGISSINEDIYVFVPLIEFFSKKIYLLTYTFYDFKELTMQLKLDFLNYKKIIIEKVKLRLKKFRLIQNKIDLIKIDVNGYEFEIIQSLNKQIAKDKPLLIIENNSKLQKISKYLKKYGYKRYFNKKNNLTIHTNENVLDVFYIYQK